MSDRQEFGCYEPLVGVCLNDRDRMRKHIGEIGLTKCESKPDSRARSRSACCPKAVSAQSTNLVSIASGATIMPEDPQHRGEACALSSLSSATSIRSFGLGASSTSAQFATTWAGGAHVASSRVKVVPRP